MNKILITQNQIREKVKELAAQVAKDYPSSNLVLIGILDGVYVLMADLTRELFDLGLKEIEVAFFGVTSYGSGTESSKRPEITKDLNISIEGRDALIVEDIVDTGLSLDFIIKTLQIRNPASLKTLCLLSKPARREVEVSVDYIGFEIENVWVEGYGMDTDHKGRGNPDIIRVTSNKPPKASLAKSG